MGYPCYWQGCKSGPLHVCTVCFQCSCDKHKRKTGCTSKEGPRADLIRKAIKRTYGIDL